MAAVPAFLGRVITSNTGGATTRAISGLNITAGDLVIVQSQTWDSPDITGISGLGGTWSELIDVTIGALRAHWWVCQAPSTISDNSGSITVTYGGGVTYASLVIAIKVTGQVQGNNGLDAFARSPRAISNNGANSITPSPASLTAGNTSLLGILGFNGGSIGTISSLQTGGTMLDNQTVEDQDGDDYRSAIAEFSSQSSYGLTWSSNPGSRVLLWAEIAAAADTGESAAMDVSSAAALTQTATATAQAARAETAAGALTQAAATTTTAARAESSAAAVTQAAANVTGAARAESSAGAMAQDGLAGKPAARAETAAAALTQTALSQAVATRAESSAAAITQAAQTTQQATLATTSAAALAQAGLQVAQVAMAASSAGSVLATGDIVESSGLLIVHGTYTGNGTSQTITLPNGQTWTPKLILLKQDDNSDSIMWFASLPAGESFFVDASGMITDGITDVDPGTFTVGSNLQANGSGDGYRYIALGDIQGNYLTTGSYTGNATDNRDITIGWGTSTPDQVLVKRSAAASLRWRSSGHSGDSSQNINAAADTNAIQGFGAGTFQVGTGAGANSSSTYYWCAIRDFSGAFETVNYTGNGSDDRNITGLVFTPDAFGWVKALSTTDEACIRFGSQTGGSSTLIANGASATNRIQAFISDGFQVGTASYVNTNAVVYNGFFAKERLYETNTSANFLTSSTGDWTPSAVQIAGVAMAASSAAGWTPTAAQVQTAARSESSAAAMAHTATATLLAAMSASCLAGFAALAEVPGENEAFYAQSTAPDLTQTAIAQQGVARSESAASAFSSTVLAVLQSALAMGSASAMTFLATIVTPSPTLPKLGRSGSRSPMAVQRSGSRRPTY